MYKLQTIFTHFRFNSWHNQGPVLVTWYKLDESNGVINGVCLSYQELTDLTNYVVNNSTNFNNQNYFACDPENTVGCDLLDLLPLKAGRMPKNLILKRIPQMKHRGGVIYPCMDIELLNANGLLNHTYNLEFDIIGYIEG